jgi:hypothetical protein
MLLWHDFRFANQTGFSYEAKNLNKTNGNKLLVCLKVPNMKPRNERERKRKFFLLIKLMVTKDEG